VSDSLATHDTTSISFDSLTDNRPDTVNSLFNVITITQFIVCQILLWVTRRSCQNRSRTSSFKYMMWNFTCCVSNISTHNLEFVLLMITDCDW